MFDEFSRWQATYRNHLPYSAESPVIGEIFSRLSEDAAHAGDEPDSLNKEEISQLINTVFWASLATEEGELARISVAIMEPGELDEGVVLANRLPLTASALVKLSPISKSKNCSIAVSCKPNQAPVIWGLLTRTPILKPLIRAREPGTVIVSVGGENLAYLTPVGSLALPRVPNWVLMVAGFLGPEADPRFDMAWYLQYLAEAMQHRRGGTILIVPESSDDWKSSVKGGYPVNSDLLSMVAHAESWKRRSEATRDPKNPFLYLNPVLKEAMSFRQAVELVGGISAVDGATVLNDKYELLGFGVKIKTVKELPDEINIANVIGSGDYPETMLFKEIGGTRHQSAASFAFEHPDAVVLVTSQDGRITIFRGGEEGLWALRRCETLLHDV